MKTHHKDPKNLKLTPFFEIQVKFVSDIITLL